MGNIASSTGGGGGHWDLSKPQPQWTKTKAVPKKSIWLQRQPSGSDSNDDWFIFKAPKSPKKSSPPKSSPRSSPRSPPKSPPKKSRSPRRR